MIRRAAKRVYGLASLPSRVRQFIIASGTPAGTDPIILTATSDSASRTTTVTLTVM
jgi:hypothetical protein